MVEIVIYSRPGCHLCDEARLVIDEAIHDHDLAAVVREVNIDDDPELQARYTWDVPVIFVAGRKAFKYRVEPKDLVARVERAMRSST
ncbi:MAG TPA: glutaredoxin family protein [Thermoanaerobaculia bacterium]|nr:glutaredoxin family protein [Thermoanaerobaculia bacterium]